MTVARRRTPAVFCLAAALSIGLGLMSGGTGRTLVAQGWNDVTTEAVQTFYQTGVPHTDWTGRVTTTYQPGDEPGSSFFPIGMYFPEPCRVDKTFSWSAYTGGSPNWDGSSYDLFIDLGTSPQTTYQGDRTQDQFNFQSLSATIDRLPADTDLYYRVYPHPWQYFFSEGPLAEGTFNKTCPSSDPDLPNVVETLQNGGFNLAMIKTPYHPQPFIDLKNRSTGVQPFEFVVDARLPWDLQGFSEQLFDPVSEGGQGYSQNPNIYGWQLEDEPLLHPPGCVQATVDRLTQKYDDHKDATDQVLFYVEGAPSYGCDSYLWTEAVRIGDAASQDNYVWSSGSSVEPIAVSMSRQTNDLVSAGQTKPSWFTTQAFSSENNPFPSPARNRAAVYTAIVHGATGIWYFMLDSFATRNSQSVGIRPTLPDSYPEQDSTWVPSSDQLTKGVALWNGVVALNLELKDLAPVLLQPTSTEDYQVFVTSYPVHTMLKSVGSDYYLIAVNMDPNGTEAQFRFSPSDTLVGAEVLFEGGRHPTTSGNVLQDSFAGFDVHVYHFRFTDSDSDGLHNSIDNCPFVSNPNQLDSDGDKVGNVCDNCPSVPNPGQQNTDTAIGNGVSVNAPNVDDATVPNAVADNLGDACETDPDIDYDGIPNGSDADPGGDITYDDNNNGIPCFGPTVDPADDGPSWDTNCNGIRDGVEGSCPLAVNPNGDDDGDGLKNTWEVCKWGTNPNVVDSDSDGMGDCKETLDTNGDGIFEYGTDVLNMARAALLPAGTGAGKFGRDGDFDLNGVGGIGFGDDVLTAARMAFGILPCE